MFTIVKSIGGALVICGLILVVFLSISSAQINEVRGENLVDDTAINPHDFTDDYYATQGINGRSIIGRRNGYDYLSTFSYSSNPTHSNVRVLATLAARGLNGELLFWFPLGQISMKGFTLDRIGSAARKNALSSPIYVFPKRVDIPMGPGSFSIFDVRQSSLILTGKTASDTLGREASGLHVIAYVNYTDKAFTKDCEEMMNFMLKKNGPAADGTPAIVDMNDLQMLVGHEMVSVITGNFFDSQSGEPIYALAPVVGDPTDGAIARDAFLILPKLNDEFLPSETIFVEQFGCLQRNKTWCLK